MAPLWVAFVVAFVVCGLMLSFLWGHDGRSMVGVVAASLGVALVVTVGGVFGRRREQAITGASAPEDRIMLMRAVQTGEAPANPAFDRGLLTIVTQRRNANRRVPWVFTLVALTYIPTTITEHRPYPIALGCFWVVLTTSAWIQRARTQGRLARLEETLRERSAA